MSRSGPGNSLVTDPVPAVLFNQTAPMVWGVLAMMSFNFIDTWFVSRLGETELAAMSFTFPVVMLLLGLGIGMMAGTSSVLARLIGAGNLTAVRRLTTDSVILGIGISIVVSVVGMATVRPLFTMLGASGRILDLVCDYMIVWYAGFVFFLVPMIGMGAIRATGDSRVQSRIMIAAALINLLLDPLLIFGPGPFPRLELTGAALATVFARAFSLVAGYWFLSHQRSLLSWRLPGFKAMARSWRALLRIALPAAGTNMIIPFANGIIVAIVAGFGTIAVAGFGAATRIEQVALVAFFAMSAVIGPIVGQNLGARQVDRVFETMVAARRFCVAAGLLLAAVLGVFARPLVGLFSDQPGVIEAGRWYLLLVPLSYGAQGLIMQINAAFNGLGRPLPAVSVSVSRMLLLYVPLAAAGARFAGLKGVYLAASISSLAMAVAGWYWFRRVVRSLDESAPCRPPG